MCDVLATVTKQKAKLNLSFSTCVNKEGMGAEVSVWRNNYTPEIKPNLSYNAALIKHSIKD